MNNNDNEFIKVFGSYSIPNGWMESETHSTNDMFFYVQEGNDNEERPNNVSVKVGENDYDEEDHMDFRDAIMSQLANQISPNNFLTASGSSTEQGYNLYVLIIASDEELCVNTLYYIVGDHKYFEIYLTNIDASDEADQAAQTIVNSFVWAEE